MEETQLKAVIQMGKDIASGKIDIVSLNNKSLQLRKKKQKTDPSNNNEKNGQEQTNNTASTLKKSKKHRRVAKERMRKAPKT